MIQRPMLAATLENVGKLKFPVLCTPKLDGIRCLKINGVALSRKFKPIPNKFIQSVMSSLPDGLDGELMVAESSFNEIQSSVMSEDGEPNFEYWIFDFVKDSLSKSYRDRIADLNNLSLPKNCKIISYTEVNSETELSSYEKSMLYSGYEGVMIRSASGPYKNGRSTEREGFLLKLKKFSDSEAEILGFEERLKNENVAELDELGYTKRAYKKENLVPADTLGAFIVKDIHTGQQFKVSTGLDDSLRKSIWNDRNSYLGKLLKYKYQPSGMKDLPRFPVFLGFRHKDDL